MGFGQHFYGFLRALTFLGALEMARVRGDCRVSFASRHAEEPLDPYVFYQHWICSDCRSGEECCRAIRASSPRVPSASCEEKVVRFSESDYSYLDAEDSTWYPRKDGQTYFASEGETDWVLTRGSGAGSFINATETSSLTTRLSEEGGMHRQFQHVLRLNVADADGSSSATLLIFLTPEWFIDQDEWLGSIECWGEEGEVPRSRVLIECSAQLHETADKIDIEQPSFVSTQHVLRVGVEWENRHDARDEAGSRIIVELNTMVHMRYPQAVGGYYHSYLPVPLLLLQGEILVASRHPILKARIPAGFSGDYLVVKWVTVLCMFVGSFIMLRGLEGVSHWC